MNPKQILNIAKSNKMLQFAMIVASIAFLHYVLIQLYIYMCVGTGLLGFFQSIISLGSPICQFINHVQFELSKYYITAWATAAVSAAAWLIAKLSG